MNPAPCAHAAATAVDAAAEASASAPIPKNAANSRTSRADSCSLPAAGGQDRCRWRWGEGCPGGRAARASDAGPSRWAQQGLSGEREIIGRDRTTHPEEARLLGREASPHACKTNDTLWHACLPSTPRAASLWLRSGLRAIAALAPGLPRQCYQSAKKPEHTAVQKNLALACLTADSLTTGIQLVGYIGLLLQPAIAASKARSEGLFNVHKRVSLVASTPSAQRSCNCQAGLSGLEAARQCSAVCGC